MEKTIEGFINNAKQWQKEYMLLRHIIQDLGLEETVKWGKPCYSHEGKNIVLIHGFKEYCALLFFKGALLADEEGILVQQTKNVQAARQLRFSDIEAIESRTEIIKKYINDAIEIEKSGKEVVMKETDDFEMAEELIDKFEVMPELQEAFERLTPGRQRQYLLHFSSPKKTETRRSRIEKAIQNILDGKGLNDR